AGAPDRDPTDRGSGLSRDLAPAVGLLALCLALVIWAGPVLDFSRATAAQILNPAAYVTAVLGTDSEATGP
ncbi:MAG: hypothetical protein ACM3ST_00165, partial [Bdellovibrio bacteriovorus]